MTLLTPYEAWERFHQYLTEEYQEDPQVLSIKLQFKQIVECPDCGRGVAHRGSCPKCGGDSWVNSGVRYELPVV